MVISSRILVLAALPLIGACDIDRYKEPIKVTPHGSAVRANMAAHIINPNPPTATAARSDGARAALGINAYRTGEVKDPTAQSTTPNTTIIEEVN